MIQTSKPVREYVRNVLVPEQIHGVKRMQNSKMAELAEISEKNRQGFHEEYKPYFEKGYLREVFHGKLLSIYSIGDLSFAAIAFTRLTEEHDYAFVPLKTDEIIGIVRDEQYFQTILGNRMKINKVGIMNLKIMEKLAAHVDKELAAGKKAITPEFEYYLFKQKGNLTFSQKLRGLFKK